MTLTVYSFLMAMLWFGLFALILVLLRSRESFIPSFGLLPLLCLLITSLVRLFLPIEFPFTKVIGSTVLMPMTLELFKQPAVWFGSLKMSLAQVLAIFWTSGALIGLFRFALEWLHAYKAVASYRPAGQDVLDMARQIAGRDVEVVYGDVPVPYIKGVVEPTIVLPEIDYNDTELKQVFMHEWQHFHNKDPWCKLITNLLCCIFWWNPLVYLLREQVEETLEVRCDFCVLAQLDEEQRDLYSQMIVDAYHTALTWQSRIPSNSFGFVQAREHPVKKKKSPTVRRFELTLSYEEVERKRKTSGIVLCVAIVLVFALSYTMVFQPRMRPSNLDGLLNVAELSEGSYLIDNGDGTYSLYLEGEYIDIQNIDREPFASMPIVQK